MHLRGRNLLRMPGLAAAAQEGPRVLFAPSGLHPMKQMRRERSESSTGSAQLDETKLVFTGRTKRPLKRRFSFVPGAARFLLPRQKKMWGAFAHAGSGVTSRPGGTPEHPNNAGCTWHQSCISPTVPLIPFPKGSFPAPKSNPPVCRALRTHTPSRHCDSRPLWGRRSGRFRPGECAPHSFFSKRECAAPGGRAASGRQKSNSMR